MVFKRYRKFVRKHRKGLIRANKMGLKAVWTAIKTLKTGQNTERKFHDKAGLISFNVGSGAPAILFNPFDGLAKSLDASGRVGDQIKALYTTMRCRFEYRPTTLADSVMVRILVILDTEPRLAAPLGAVALRDAVLQVTSTGPQQINSPYRVTIGTAGVAGGYVGQRYKVLRDFRFTLDNVGQKQKWVSINLNHMKNKIRGLRVKYTDYDVNDYAADNRLYVLAVTDNGTSTDIEVDGDYSRVCFVDN